jgi:CMP-N-acetylneuraminic acid synthetase
LAALATKQGAAIVPEGSEVLAIIPARGGSKGLVNKNLSQLGGRPLVAHTIRAALRSRCITRTIVSTDSETIATVSRDHGAEVPFLRPDMHTGDNDSVAAALQDYQKRLETRERYFPDIVVILFCTSPFRPPGMIDFLIEKLRGDYKRAYTVKRIPAFGHRYYRLAGDSPERLTACGASAQPGGIPTRKIGLFHGFSVHAKPKDSFVYHVDNPVCLIDIDTRSDLEMAQLVATEGLSP